MQIYTILNLCNMEYLKPLIVIAAIALFTVACEYENPVPFPVSNEPVSFSEDIIPYFDAACNMAGCHNTGGISPDLTAANAYDAIMNDGLVDTNDPEKSVFYKKINTGSMAQYSSPSETAMILKWIKEGAENN